MLKSDLCDCSDAYIVVNGGVTVTEPDNQKKKKKKKKVLHLHLKTMHHLSTAFQK